MDDPDITMEEYIQLEAEIVCRRVRSLTGKLLRMPKETYKEDLDSEMVMVKIPRCMQWLDTYDEPIGDLDIMKDEAENSSPLSTPQVLPSFEKYTPPMTYPKEVEETLGTPMEVELLNQLKLEDVGLTNHNIPVSYKELPIFDEPEPQP
uniref:Uncharacterized protein n=1 Tax=Tanacetum cinerariifolium TaxID=118510 RepID=A0A6L2JZR6_TANCI|nr:hypothetical protein [Tanacetum cinerariifolium]